MAVAGAGAASRTWAGGSGGSAGRPRACRTRAWAPAPRWSPDGGRLALLGTVHPHQGQGTQGPFQFRGDRADRVLCVRRRRADPLQHRGDQHRGHHHRQRHEEQQRVEPRHERDGPGRDQCPRDQVDERLRDDLAQDGRVGGDAGGQVTGAVPVVLAHLQPQEPVDQPVAQPADHALARALQEVAADGARRGLRGEHGGQEQQDRPERPPPGTPFDGLPGEQRLGESEGRRREAEDDSQGDGAAVPDREAVQGGDGRPRGRRPRGRRRRPCGAVGVAGPCAALTGGAAGGRDRSPSDA